jgi:hypothetical protein
LAKRFAIDLVYLDGSGQAPSADLSRVFAASVSGVKSKYCVPFSQAKYFLFSTELYGEATRLLENVYGWFTEGFATADLQDAAAVLQQLRAG